MALTDVLEDVDDKERRDQVVDALHVAAGWVADCPDKQDPLKNLRHTHKHTHKDIESKQFVDKEHLHYTNIAQRYSTYNDMKFKKKKKQ